MKKLILLIASLLTTSVFAFEQPVVREETTPPPPSGPVTVEHIPALITGAKPVTNPVPPQAANEPAPIIGDEDLVSG